ncbi:PIN domain-containing protein [Synechococcus sp. 1G10]|uniref:PIN domain-containing protein n=1 Tax=Synechococcus sp. 1G10 TaxID=2025605 RepID=UPI00117D0BCD|nr:PIN domain-containing protein [Synechococcus sp. 1G10]
MAGVEVVSTELNLILDAHQMALRHQPSWFDALKVKAAFRSGCPALFGKNLNINLEWVSCS